MRIGQFDPTGQQADTSITDLPTWICRVAAGHSRILHITPTHPNHCPPRGSPVWPSPRPRSKRSSPLGRLPRPTIWARSTCRQLAGVDLELYAGEFVVLLGPSGSGKSTLLNILGGLGVPSSGEVFYRDRQLTEFDDAAARYRREHVGFVFQFYNLIPSLTARENIEPDHRDRPRPHEARRGVELGRPRQTARPFFRRIDVGRRTAAGRHRPRVAKRPDVLLCDEPTGAARRPYGHSGARSHSKNQR